MNRTLLKIILAVCTMSGVAHADGVALGQKTLGAQNMSNTLRKLRTQHVPAMEETLRERGLPKSVVRAPSKILENGVQGPLKDRLELGLTMEPTVQQGGYTVMEMRGNAASKTDGRVNISANVGTIQAS